MIEVRCLGAVGLFASAIWSTTVLAQVQSETRDTAPAVTPVPVAPAAGPAPASGAEPARPPRHAQFDLNGIDVEGNTLLATDVMQTALEPFLGPAKTPDDVDAARDSLEQLYHELGYKTVTVAIPQQTLHDGIVELRVTEGVVRNIGITGDKYTSRQVLRKELPTLAPGETLNFQDLKGDLVYANRLPTRKVTPSLRAGSAPGAVDIELTVEDQLPFHASLEANNRHSKGTTDDRVVAGLGYDNLFQLGHSVSLSFQTAPQRVADGRVYYGSYLAPLGDGSWNLMASALKTSSNIAAFTGVNVVGSGETYGLKLIKQFAGIEGRLYPSVSVEIDAKHLTTVAEVSSGAINTPVRYYPLTLDYSQILRMESQSLQDDIELVVPLPHTGSSQSTLDLSRFGARRQWFYLRTSNTYTLNFLRYMQAGVHLGAQITDQPLISSEQLSVGGADTVRGYLESEALGDYGYNGSVELRLPSFPDFFPAASWTHQLSELRPFGFVDAATVRLHGPFPDDSTSHSTRLLSAGGGVTTRIFDYFYGAVDFAVPLRNGPFTKKDDSRILFRVTASF